MPQSLSGLLWPKSLSDEFVWKMFGLKDSLFRRDIRCCDGVYDPALDMYYQPVQPHPQSVGLFTSLENHQVPIHDPASLAKFMYAGHAPVDCIDPA